MHVSDNFKLVGISVLIIFGLAACDEVGTETARNNVPVTTDVARNNVQVAAVDPDQLEALKKTVMPDGMPVNNWPQQGFAVNADTRIFCWSDQFGKIGTCQIDILGRRVTTGELAIPMWSLIHYAACGDTHGFLHLKNFFGSRKPLRLFFDGDSKFIEVVGNDDSDSVFVRMRGELGDRLLSAKSVKVLHGVAATEISYIYDLSAYRNAVALTEAMCR